jgi:hypothetical protein
MLRVASWPATLHCEVLMHRCLAPLSQEAPTFMRFFYLVGFLSSTRAGLREDYRFPSKVPFVTE